METTPYRTRDVSARDRWGHGTMEMDSWAVYRFDGKEAVRWPEENGVVKAPWCLWFLRLNPTLTLQEQN